ncbi:sensor histidine kinase [Nocardia amamiensis]|uniref:histidine kinase n=1 Tax=Nocardia amamiensis TaxID=404578 RepID=A0ABS0CXN0_9NOCA|nr:nitrate- and nitrite sensing domain-containing protein [Nocardia amamiensis]MBF6301106.1 sensor histidine kinase [Nocardia amamiensis]
MSKWAELRKFAVGLAKSSQRNVRGRVGVRVRLLAIVLISSVTLLAIGVGAAGYLVNSSRASKEWAELAGSTTGPAILMVQAFQEERRLSLLYLAGDAEFAQGLAAARQRSDAALAAVMAKGDAARKLNPDGSADDIEGYNKLFAMVPTLRGGVDAQQVAPNQVFEFFSQVIGTIIAASMLAARVAPEADLAVELGYGVDPLRAAESLSMADTSGAVALTLGEHTPAQLTEFNRLVGEFRSEVAFSGRVLKGTRLAQLNAITAGPAYQNVIAMQDAVMLRGPVSANDTTADESTRPSESTGRSQDPRSTSKTAPLPMSVAAWQEASGQVVSALLKLWEDQSRDAHDIARDQGERTAQQSLLGGAAVLLIATLAFLAALILANRFIGRMRQLRRDTLELADNQLPDLMRRLGAGENVDSTDETSRLDFGTDELGQVADAFNRAHVAAVAAAVAEAKTRAGVNAVFLNIAHRSQVVVHRQLTLLDEAERKEENADQLELLFQLDHLATRARRNAENLIILGGEQPGRRWRKPVPLLELVRGAVAESLDYARIQTGRMPEAQVSSKAVADLIHLMAELMDNATAFSPPQARVEVSGVVVGRGVAIEIIDQGLGMSDADFAARNELLSNSPDFSVVSLSGDARLGLFVVAKLANRHGVSVRLGESVYGGVRAVVLIPTALLQPQSPAHDEHDDLDGKPVESTGTTAQDDATPQPAARQSAWFTPHSEQGSSAPARSTGAHGEGSESNSVAATYPQATADPRPALPRRRRQSESPTETATPAIAPVRQRTADEARNLMSAIENGTRQGRRTPPDTD